MKWNPLCIWKQSGTKVNMGGLQRDASVRGYYADSRLHSCGKFHQQQLYWFLNLRNIRPGKSATEISMDVWVGYPCLSLVSVFFLGVWANQLSDNAWLTQKPNLQTEDTQLKDRHWIQHWKESVFLLMLSQQRTNPTKFTLFYCLIWHSDAFGVKTDK